MPIILKNVNELTTSEKQQLEELIHRYYKNATPKYISNRLEKDLGYDIVMLKEGEVIQGVSYYHLTKYKGSGWSRSSYVLHFGQAMKRSDYRSNIVMRLGWWYCRKYMGNLFLLKNITGVAYFSSPKAFEHFTHRFPNYHCDVQTENDTKAQRFVADYFNNVRGLSINFQAGFCFESKDLNPKDITEDWHRLYRAKNEAFNQLFIRNGIIEMKDNRVLLKPRLMTACGLRRPLSFSNSLNLSSVSPVEHRSSVTENIEMPLAYYLS